MTADQYLQRVYWRLMRALYPIFGVLLGLVPAIATSAPLCHPLKVSSCALPYPSDLFTRADAASPTGQWIDYPDAVLPVMVRAALTYDFNPQVLFADTSGFAATVPVYFELPAAIDTNSLPTDGGSTVVVFDLGPRNPDDPAYLSKPNARGNRINVVAHLSHIAQQDNVTYKSNVIETWPRARYEYGHHYVAALTTQLRRGDGSSFTAADGLTGFSTSDEPHVSDALRLLEQKGYPLERLISFTHFTVRDASEVQIPMRAMMSKTYTQDHPIRNVTVAAQDRESITVTGQFRSTDFRDSVGGLRYQASHDGTPSWITFLLTLPKNAKTARLPIAIWGHGGFTAKEVRHPLEQNNRLGIATLSIDYPNHGSRIDPQNTNGHGYVVASNSPYKLAQQMGVVIQAPLDQMALLKAAQSRLGAELQSLRSNGFEVPDIDTNNIIVQGLSFGTIAGTTFGAFAPGIKGGYFENGGGSFLHMLSNSQLWDLGGRNMMPPAASGADMHFVIAMMQHYSDIGDISNFAHQYRNPLPGLTARPLAYIYALKDGVIINETTEAIAEIAQLPLVADVLEARPQLGGGRQGFDADGYGLIQNTYGLEQMGQMLDEIHFAENTLQENGLESQFSDLLSMLPDSVDYFFISAFLQRPDNFPAFSEFFADNYRGSPEEFATHFNSNNDRADTYEQAWLCAQLPLDRDTCATSATNNPSSNSSFGDGSMPLYPEPKGGASDGLFLMIASVLAVLRRSRRFLNPFSTCSAVR